MEQRRILGHHLVILLEKAAKIKEMMRMWRVHNTQTRPLERCIAYLWATTSGP
jgi:hypothetical protein